MLLRWKLCWREGCYVKLDSRAEEEAEEVLRAMRGVREGEGLCFFATTPAVC